MAKPTEGMAKPTEGSPRREGMRGCIYGLPISIGLWLLAIPVLHFLLERPLWTVLLFGGVVVSVKLWARQQKVRAA